MGLKENSRLIPVAARISRATEANENPRRKRLRRGGLLVGSPLQNLKAPSRLVALASRSVKGSRPKRFSISFRIDMVS